MKENTDRIPDEQDDEQRAPEPELAGQLAFDGFQDLAESEQESEQEDTETSRPDLILAEDGRVITADGKDIKDDPEALAEWKRQIKRIMSAYFRAMTARKTTKELAEFYLLVKSKYEDTAQEFLDALPPATAAEIKAAADKIENDAETAEALQSRAEAVKAYLATELKKDCYKGETLDSLLYDRDPAALADPENEKTKLIRQAIAAAERAAHQPHEKIKAADQQEAKEAGAIYYQPKEVLTITDKNYKGGIAFYDAGGTSLAKIKDNIKIQIDKNGRIFFPQLGEASVIELEDTLTHELIDNIDLSLLRRFYTYIVQEKEAAFKRGEDERTIQDGKLTIDVETLAAQLGESRTSSTRARDKVIAAAKSFHNIAGRLVYDQHARPSYFQVLNFEKYDSKNNTITVRAPYLSYLFEEIFNHNKKLDADGKTQKDARGLPDAKPHEGRGIQSKLVTKYRNNKAVLENLFILDAVIEPAGKHPNITAAEMINRNIYLQDLLQGKATMRQNQTLKRVFKKTWQALRETALIQMYNNINTPDPDDPAAIPTVKTLDICYHFDNTGKKKQGFSKVIQAQEQEQEREERKAKAASTVQKRLETLKARKSELIQQGASEAEIESVRLEIISIEDSLANSNPQAPQE